MNGWIKNKLAANMFDYLYYKLYQATLKGSLKEMPHFMAPIFFAGLIGVNILVIYLFLVKIDVLPYVFKNTKQGSWLILVIIILSIIYFGKNRRLAILEKYACESNKNRIRGNIIVSIYVAISFLSIFAVGLFKPGQL